MSTVLETHIEIDGRGVPWIAGANTKVVEIVIDKIAHGSSPEEIHFQYPHLTLAQIHSALAYYYDHKDEIDSEIAAQLERVDKLAEQAKDSPGRRRLRSQGLL
ncbi:MAG TPA: DUF433 domain-containing protein [Blastocatellia bacterium]|nr:DUF433 domain-containing protein [Blastocatellia bacterium]